MYELTSFLETIAAASASIVAILGGFIASRLISISNDRTASIERTKQIEEELKAHRNVREHLQSENDEDDAIYFISNHMDALISGEELSSAYDSSEHPSLQQEILEPYWVRASKIWSEYYSVIKTKSAIVNDDNVPKVLAEEYVNDDFSYSICQEIAEELERRKASKEREERKEKNKSFGIQSDFDFSEFSEWSDSIKSYSGEYGYIKNNNMIDKQDSEIIFLELEKNQINNHIKALRRPKGMKLGLGIFATFAVVCIICPLIFTPFITENFSYYLVVKYVFLGLFVAGLAGIFAYLVYLLRWDDKIE